MLLVLSFAACEDPEIVNPSKEDNDPLVTDTTSNFNDTTKNVGDTTVVGDSTSNVGDTTLNNGDTTVIGDTTVNPGDTTIIIGDTTVNNGDTTVNNGDTTTTVGDTIYDHLDYNLDVDLMLSVINKYRKEGIRCGSVDYKPVAPVKWNKYLGKASLDHANDMYQNNYLDHVGLDGSHFTERATAAGYTGVTLRENIALGSTSEQGVVSLWMISGTYCRNIMEETATEIGAGRSEQGNYWDVLIGREK